MGHDGGQNVGQNDNSMKNDNITESVHQSTSLPKFTQLFPRPTLQKFIKIKSVRHFFKWSCRETKKTNTELC